MTYMNATDRIQPRIVYRADDSIEAQLVDGSGSVVSSAPADTQRLADDALDNLKREYHAALWGRKPLREVHLALAEHEALPCGCTCHRLCAAHQGSIL